MHAKPRLTRGTFADTGVQAKLASTAAHWFRLITTLLLVFVIGSTAQLSPAAQAAPVLDGSKWYMDVPNPKTKVCLGDTVEYLAQVFYVFTTEPRQDFAITGVRLEATSSNTNIGSFKQDSAIAGFGNDDLVSASFLFTAKKTGTTNLFFEGFVDKKFTDTYISFTVPVTVINCKYKVSSRSLWIQRTPNGTVVLNTFMIGVKLTGDEQGHFSVTGSSNVTWVMTAFVPNYGSTNTIQFSTANLDGQLFENNQFVLNLSLNSTSGSETNCGAAGCGGGEVILVPQPLKITFPAEGGTRRVSHGLKGPGGELTGWSVVTLQVEKP